MNIKRLISILAILLLTGACAFFNEYWEPGDVLKEIENSGDNTAPAIEITSHSDGDLVPYQYTLAGTVEDNVYVDEIYVNYSLTNWVQVERDGNNWSILCTAPQFGIFTNSVYAVDSSGNASTNNITLNGGIGRIQPGDLNTNDRFGYKSALSADGQTAVISAEGKDMIYILTTSDQWNTYQLTNILSPDSPSADNFGEDVAISADGSTVIVSDNYIDDGKVYVFSTPDGWNTINSPATLIPGDSGTNDWFGNNIAISGDGDTIIVGDHQDLDSSGAAYIYHNTGTWTNATETKKISDPNNDYFGCDVDISADGNTILIGEERYSSYIGSAYIFKTSDDWQSVGFTNLITNTFDWVDSANEFGDKVALSADASTAIIGAYRYYSATYQGAAFIYRTENAWTNISSSNMIKAYDAAPSKRFGDFLSINSNGTCVVITASSDITSTQGSAYILKSSDNWTTMETNKIEPDFVEDSSFFAHSTSISADGRFILIGAKGEDSGKGTVYLLNGDL